MARGLNIFVNIGAKLLPSLNSTATAAERRFGLMARRMRISAAETRLAGREMQAAMRPLVGLAAAGGLMFGARKAIGDSAEFVHELQLFRNAGRSSKEIATGIMAANRAITALPTTTLIDNLKVLNETTGAFGSFQHAVENLTFNQRIGSMMQNMLGDKAGSPGEMFNNIVRAMEMRGSAQDHVRYQREVGQLYRSMIFTRGAVNPEEFLGYAQQANPYIKGMSTRFMTKIAPSLIQEFGGDRAGTMQNTWTGTILGKAKNKISTEAWIKLGLLDPKQVVYNKVGPVGWKPGAIKGTDLALRDPLAWSEKVLIPALKAQGFNTKDQLSLAKALMPLFRDRNANRLANTLVYDQDRMRLHKDERLINQVPSAEKAYAQSLRNDPTLAWQAMKSSLTNLASVLFGTGKGESPVAVALVNMARGINWLAQALERHPRIAQMLGAILVGSAGLAALRVVGIGLRFILGPLRILTPLWRLFFSSVGKVGPRVPWIRSILAGLRSLGGWLLGVGRFLGPMALRGLALMGPWILRGIAAAFGLLSNPVGWAILAVAAAALVWRFRSQIAAAWGTLVAWFRNTAWPMVRNTFTSINWRSVGMAIADALTFGLASKLPAIGARIRSALTPTVTGAPAWNSRADPTRRAIAGMRAAGGPVSRGLTYLVGERGPELFHAPMSGSIVPAGKTRAIMEGGSAMASRRSSPVLPRDRRDAARGGSPVHIDRIVIEGARDPRATAVEVERVLRRMMGGQSGLYSD